MQIEVGLSQTLHGSAAALPTGTRPDAIAADDRAEGERHDHGRSREERAEPRAPR